VTKKRKRSRSADQPVHVHGVRRDPPELRRLARALIELTQLQAEADAHEEHRQRQRRRSARKQRGPTPTVDDDRGAA